MQTSKSKVRGEAPPMTTGGEAAIRRLLGAKSNVAHMQTIWQLAYDQRNASLRSFVPLWRPVILAVRAAVRPTSKPRLGTEPPKRCHDENPFD